MMKLPPDLQAIAEEAMADLRAGRMEPERIPWEFELRRPGELSSEYLGRVLDWAGFPTLAANARLGHYDDYSAPAEVADGLETMRLIRDVRKAAAALTDDASGYTFKFAERGQRAQRAAQVENAAKCGEFDATKEESDRWAASKDGQETFAELVNSATGEQLHSTFEEMLKHAGRNDQCPCGSGKKFKRCHGA